MRLLKFFCFKWTIATGVQVTGYLNLWQAVVTIGLYTALSQYAFISMAILPIWCFYVFHTMMKKDGIKIRRKNFLWYMGSTTANDIVQIIQLVITTTEAHNGGECNRGRICAIVKMPWIAVTIVFIVTTMLWHIYLILILRQHWLNKRDGRGDAKNIKSSDLPDYLLS